MASKRMLQILAAAVALAAAGTSEGRSEPAPAKRTVAAARSAEDRGGSDAPKMATPEKAAEKAGEKAGEKAAGEKGSGKKSAREEAKAPERSEADDIWADLVAGNRRFMGGHLRERELLKDREALVADQHPDAMVLGCSDSRVSPELVFDKTLGELFVVRVAGNVAEPSAIGSLEYACDHLHTKVLVILGHEKCGAVAAAASAEWMPSPNLHDIVKRISPALIGIEKCKDPAEYSLRQVAANVDKTADDVLNQSPILTKAVADGDLKIIRAVYHLKTGEVERLDGPAKPAETPALATTSEGHGR